MYCEIDFENNHLIFADPISIIQTYKLSEIESCFAEMEKAADRGYYLAGFLSYEAGYVFEKVLREKEVFNFPLLCFGVYPHPLSFSPLSRGRCPSKSARGGRRRTEGVRKNNEIFNLTKQEYFSKINAIQDYIKAGDVYQITFCVKKKFGCKGDPHSLYRELLDFQPVPYPAYIEHKDFNLLSLSPEMFIKKKNEKIITKPMKGTLIRDGSFLNDIFGKYRLHFDAKNRAENIMITDLLRNDLGRICEKRSVAATKLYEVAKYRTVFQMTSTVKGNLSDENIRFHDIFKALFPSGSVTGAPKIRAMEIIRELENEERKIYTGAIGYITPQRDMFFNVPIRTILMRGSEAEMGIGGGITYYSTPEGEYEECLIKARFLNPHERRQFNVFPAVGGRAESSRD